MSPKLNSSAPSATSPPASAFRARVKKRSESVKNAANRLTVKPNESFKTKIPRRNRPRPQKGMEFRGRPGRPPGDQNSHQLRDQRGGRRQGRRPKDPKVCQFNRRSTGGDHPGPPSRSRL